MNLEVGERWRHPVHVFHDPDRPGRSPSAHTGRMSAELGVARALSGVMATVARHRRPSTDRPPGVVPRPPRRRHPPLTLTGTADPLQRAALRPRGTLPLAAAGIIGSAYERIDIWLLALLEGSASVAVYVAAYKLYDSVLLPANAVASSAVAAAGSDLATNARRVGRRLALRAALVTAPITAAVAFASPVLLRAAFGNHYGDASGAVRVLVATVPGAALVAATPIALLCRRHLVARWTIAALAGNIAANLVLVPTFNARGAALAFLITDTLLLAVLFAVLPAPGSVSGPAAVPSPRREPSDATAPPPR